MHRTLDGCLGAFDSHEGLQKLKQDSVSQTGFAQCHATAHCPTWVQAKIAHLSTTNSNLQSTSIPWTGICKNCRSRKRSPQFAVRGMQGFIVVFPSDCELIPKIMVSLVLVPNKIAIDQCLSFHNQCVLLIQTCRWELSCVLLPGLSILESHATTRPMVDLISPSWSHVAADKLGTEEHAWMLHLCSAAHP